MDTRIETGGDHHLHEPLVDTHIRLLVCEAGESQVLLLFIRYRS